MRCSTGQLGSEIATGTKMVNDRTLSRRCAGFSHGFDGGPMCLHKARGFVAVSWRWNLRRRVWLEDFKEHEAERRSAD
jgi:hypothetical protein